jgi:hypothetical protein
MIAFYSAVYAAMKFLRRSENKVHMNFDSSRSMAAEFSEELGEIKRSKGDKKE